MSAVSLTFLAASEQAASANGASIPVPTVSTMNVVVDVTAQTGTWTSGKWAVWLEGSVDGGTTWARLVADTVVKSISTAHKTADVVVSANASFIVSLDATTPAIDQYMATYTRFPDYVRARWIMDGTTPRVTFSVKAVAK